MIVGFVIELAVGALCIVMGLLVWVKRKLSLLHSYHYKNVKEQNVPSYARMMGVGLIVIGVGIAVTGFFNLFYLRLWWVPILVGFVVGLTVIVIAQKKYNGSIFGS